MFLKIKRINYIGLPVFEALQALEQIRDKIARHLLTYLMSIAVFAVVADIFTVADHLHGRLVEELAPNRRGTVNQILVLTQLQCIVEQVFCLK